MNVSLISGQIRQRDLGNEPRTSSSLPVSLRYCNLAMVVLKHKVILFYLINQIVKMID